MTITVNGNPRHYREEELVLMVAIHEVEAYFAHHGEAADLIDTGFIAYHLKHGKTAQQIFFIATNRRES